jgi:DNA-directed RNA polymerase subunit E'/Rpb7
MTIEKEQLISDTILVPVRKIYQNKKIDGYLLHYLKKEYENKCHNNGYVIPDSIEIVQRSVGKIETINNESFIKYNINYKNKSIIPTKDDVFECVIDSITKMGIIAYLDYRKEEDSSIKESPLLFIIPKEFLPEGKIDQLKKDSTINVKVLDTRIKFRAEQIQIVGEAIF